MPRASTVRRHQSSVANRNDNDMKEPDGGSGTGTNVPPETAYVVPDSDVYMKEVSRLAFESKTLIDVS